MFRLVSIILERATYCRKYGLSIQASMRSIWQRKVVENVEDQQTQISLPNAKILDKRAVIGLPFM